MALEAYDIARHEKRMSAIRAAEHAKPSSQRKDLYDAPLVRSTQAGGSGTRRRVGTEDEARALAAIKGRGKAHRQRQRPRRRERKAKDVDRVNNVSFDSLSFLGAEGDLLLQDLGEIVFKHVIHSVDLEFLV